jgi:general secretion pathway protein K
MTLRPHRTSAADGRDGFIIVAVLWILAALATLASIISVYIINAATAFTIHDERLQAETMARAAIELTVYQFNLQGQAAAPTRGSFAFRIGNATVATDFVAETARIDLNAAPKELLSGLFVGLGAPRPAADTYADRIIGWRSPPAENTAVEANLYRAAGVVYSPRGGLFQHVAELGLVMGIPEIMVERALPFLTVYSGQAAVNVMDAAPQVLAALPGMTPERLDAVLAQRAAGAANRDRLVGALGAAQTMASSSASRSVRVTARATFDSGQRVTTEAVIFILDSGTDAYRVLTWRDDIEDGPAEPRRIVTR